MYSPSPHYSVNYQFRIDYFFKAHPGLTDLFVREARKARARDREVKKPEPKKEAEKPSILEKLKRPIQKNAPNNSAKLFEQEL